MQKLSLKVMNRQMQDISVRYRLAKVQVMMFDPHRPNQDKSLYESNQKFIETFHYLLDSMIPENRQIIINDYLQRKDHGWWLDSYARSTYYRQKNLALRELLTFIK